MSIESLPATSGTEVSIVLCYFHQNLVKLLLPPGGVVGGVLHPAGLHSHQVGVLPHLEVCCVSASPKGVVWDPVTSLNNKNLLRTFREECLPVYHQPSPHLAKLHSTLPTLVFGEDSE